MSRPTFQQRAAHLSYVAPLISYVIWLQVMHSTTDQEGSWLRVFLPGLVALAGLFLAFSALRRPEQNADVPRIRWVAWLGGALNLALLARMTWAFAA